MCDIKIDCNLLSDYSNLIEDDDYHIDGLQITKPDTIGQAVQAERLYLEAYPHKKIDTYMDQTVNLYYVPRHKTEKHSLKLASAERGL